MFRFEATPQGGKEEEGEMRQTTAKGRGKKSKRMAGGDACSSNVSSSTTSVSSSSAASAGSSSAAATAGLAAKNLSLPPATCASDGSGGRGSAGGAARSSVPTIATVKRFQLRGMAEELRHNPFVGPLQYRSSAAAGCLATPAMMWTHQHRRPAPVDEQQQPPQQDQRQQHMSFAAVVAAAASAAAAATAGSDESESDEGSADSSSGDEDSDHVVPNNRTNSGGSKTSTTTTPVRRESRAERHYQHYYRHTLEQQQACSGSARGHVHQQKQRTQQERDTRRVVQGTYRGLTAQLRDAGELLPSQERSNAYVGVFRHAPPTFRAPLPRTTKPQGFRDLRSVTTKPPSTTATATRTPLNTPTKAAAAAPAGITANATRTRSAETPTKYLARHLQRAEVAKLPVVAYSGTGKSGQSLCPICTHKFFSRDLLRRLPCGHLFHTGCVDSWLTGGMSRNTGDTTVCPQCGTSALIGLHASASTPATATSASKKSSSAPGRSGRAKSSDVMPALSLDHNDSGSDGAATGDSRARRTQSMPLHTPPMDIEPEAFSCVGAALFAMEEESAMASMTESFLISAASPPPSALHLPDSSESLVSPSVVSASATSLAASASVTPTRRQRQRQQQQLLQQHQQQQQQQQLESCMSSWVVSDFLAPALTAASTTASPRRDVNNHGSLVHSSTTTGSHSFEWGEDVDSRRRQRRHDRRRSSSPVARVAEVDTEPEDDSPRPSNLRGSGRRGAVSSPFTSASSSSDDASDSASDDGHSVHSDTPASPTTSVDSDDKSGRGGRGGGAGWGVKSPNPRAADDFRGHRRSQRANKSVFAFCDDVENAPNYSAGAGCAAQLGVMPFNVVLAPNPAPAPPPPSLVCTKKLHSSRPAALTLRQKRQLAKSGSSYEESASAHANRRFWQVCSAALPPTCEYLPYIPAQ